MRPHRIATALLALPAGLGACLMVGWGAWHLCRLALPPVAEAMQAGGLLDPRPFGKSLILGGVFALTLVGATLGRSARKLGAGLAVSGLAALLALLLTTWVGPKLPAALASPLSGVGLSSLLLFFILVLAGATVLTVRVVRLAWQVPQRDWALLAPIALGAFGFKDLRGQVAELDGPVRNAGQPIEAARLLLAEAAYAQVQPVERPIQGMPARPGVYYSASGPIRRKQKGNADTPLWRCYRQLTEAPDPTARSGGTLQEECVRRLRRAGVSDPESDALDVVLSVCKKPRDDLVPYYVESCSNKIKSRLRAQPRLTAADHRRLETYEAAAPEPRIDGRLDSARCLQAARAHLSPREHEVLVLDAQGWGYREIAARIGVTYDNVRQIASRARPKVKALCPDPW